MQGTQYRDGRRIRNVPIRIEGDHRGSPRTNSGSRMEHGSECDARNGNHENCSNQQSRPQSHLNDPNWLNQSTSPHTSSIDINYEPQVGSFKGQPRAPRANDQEQIQQTESSSRLGAQQADKSELNKENNSESNAFKSSNGASADRSNSDKLDERKPSPIPPVIPLPPPPSQAHPKPGQTEAREPAEQKLQQEQSAQQGQTKECEEIKGPLGVISATKAEVHRLLQEVVKCDETSTKSKEFLRLEELLTLCILKLDGIDAPELRQQRKEVINMINKCSDILERRINLNNDIKQLAAKCQ